MGIFGILSDVAEVVGNVSKVVVAPIEVSLKVTKAITKEVSEVVTEVKDSMLK